MERPWKSNYWGGCSSFTIATFTLGWPYIFAILTPPKKVPKTGEGRGIKNAECGIRTRWAIFWFRIRDCGLRIEGKILEYREIGCVWRFRISDVGYQLPLLGMADQVDFGICQVGGHAFRDCEGIDIIHIDSKICDISVWPAAKFTIMSEII